MAGTIFCGELRPNRGFWLSFTTRIYHISLFNQSNFTPLFLSFFSTFIQADYLENRAPCPSLTNMDIRMQMLSTGHFISVISDVLYSHSQMSSVYGNHLLKLPYFQDRSHSMCIYIPANPSLLPSRKVLHSVLIFISLLSE